MHLKSLDTVRAIACLLVVLAHAGGYGIFFKIRGAGALGVMLFFVLSGFLMEQHYGNNKFNLQKWKEYALLRWARIYPLYAIVILLSFGAFTFFPAWSVYKLGVNSTVNHLLLMGNYSVFWTIAIEAKYYLIFPLLTMLLTLACRIPSAKMCAYAALWAVSLYFSGYGGSPVKELTPYLAFFIAGGFAAILQQSLKPMKDCALLALLAFGASTVALIMHTQAIGQHFAGKIDHPWENSRQLAVICFSIVLSAVFAERLLQPKYLYDVIRFISLRSYSMYLLHLPIIVLIKTVMPSALPLLQFGCAALVLCAVCDATYRFIEEPARRWAREFTHTQTASAPPLPVP